MFEGRGRRRAALGAERLQDDDVEPGRVRVALERSRGADVRQEREAARAGRSSFVWDWSEGSKNDCNSLIVRSFAGKVVTA